MKVEVLQIKLISDFKPLRAFANVKVGGWVIHDFRIIKQNGQRAFVNSPQVSWRDSETGDLKFKSILTIPPEEKEVIDTAILHAWRMELEKTNASQK